MLGGAGGGSSVIEYETMNVLKSLENLYSWKGVRRKVSFVLFKLFGKMNCSNSARH